MFEYLWLFEISFVLLVHLSMQKYEVSPSHQKVMAPPPPAYQVGTAPPPPGYILQPGFVQPVQAAPA